MGRFLVLLIALTASGLMACSPSASDQSGGVDVSSEFVSEFNGTYVEQTPKTQSGETLWIRRDGQIEVLKLRQVGDDDNPLIPRPTVCSFILHGQLQSVLQLEKSQRLRVSERGEEYLLPQTHHLIFKVEHVRLTNDLHPATVATGGCHQFQKIMNDKQPTYTYAMELFSDGHLRLHTSGTYGGGELTDAVLDEIYLKQ